MDCVKYLRLLIEDLIAIEKSFNCFDAYAKTNDINEEFVYIINDGNRILLKFKRDIEKLIDDCECGNKTLNVSEIVGLFDLRKRMVAILFDLNKWIFNDLIIGHKIIDLVYLSDDEEDDDD
jgi:hypothetical protein